jgi:hypothetical protein
MIALVIRCILLESGWSTLGAHGTKGLLGYLHPHIAHEMQYS